MKNTRDTKAVLADHGGRSGGNLDLFENQDHEKNDGAIFHAGFRSKPKSKAIHHGGKRRDTEEVKGQSNGI